jgi:hypothetical protein
LFNPASTQQTIHLHTSESSNLVSTHNFHSLTDLSSVPQLASYHNLQSSPSHAEMQIINPLVGFPPDQQQQQNEIHLSPMFARRSNRKFRAYYHPPEFSLHDQASNSQIGQLPQPPLHSIVNISTPTTTT